jgi:hypothetical protein
LKISLEPQNTNEKITITWFKEFIGIGYDYHDVHMNVFPLFEDKTRVSDLWKKTFERLDDDQVKIRFVEHGNNYWFIVYTVRLEDNIGFAKNVPMSENYLRFKQGFSDKAILRFGIYKKNEEEMEKNNKGRRHRFELLKKSKVSAGCQVYPIF